MEGETTIIALSVFLILNYLDFLTTRSGILKGAHEKNPLANKILKKYGFIGLFVFKFFLTALLPLIVLLQNGDIESALWIWNIILSLVVASNSYTNYRSAKNN